MKIIVYADEDAKVISNILNEIHFKTYEVFNNYCDHLKDMIHDFSIKLYIISFKTINCLKVIRDIRNNDFKSIIIIITNDEQIATSILKERLMLLTMISVYDNFKNNLINAIQLSYQIVSSYSNILYIKSSNKIVSIITATQVFKSKKPLKKLAKEFGNNFIQSHKSCYININQVKYIDFSKNIIYFKNDTCTTLLSRTYKKNLIDTFQYDLFK